MEQAYEALRVNGDESRREQAREFALQYDADRVMAEHWLPVLEKLSRPQEVPALPNRAARRQAAKAKAVA